MQHERRKEIITKINKLRTLKVADLTEEFQVSIETIRRDLEFLEKQGHLQRVYGGAVLRGYYSLTEPDLVLREQTNSREKQAIGEKAASLIEHGDSLFIDFGTTTVEMARKLGGKKNLTILTNGMLVAQELVRLAENSTGWKIILLGGEVRTSEFTVSGAMADSNLKNFYIAKAVIGMGGLDPRTGVTDYHVQEASACRLAIAQAHTVIGLADYSKFGVTALNRICPTDRLDILVTDWTVPATVLNEYRALGIDVHIAGLPEGNRKRTNSTHGFDENY